MNCPNCNFDKWKYVSSDEFKCLLCGRIYEVVLVAKSQEDYDKGHSDMTGY